MDESLTKYFVDGEWRNFKIVTETIKVKGADDIEFSIRFTHRGPLMVPALMQSGGVLFGGALPDAKFQHHYSHMWGGMHPGDDFMTIIMKIADGMGVKDLMD